MIIEVTQADIDAGVRDVSSLLGGRAASCPVALAMRRCVNAAMVFETSWIDAHGERHPLPEAVREFIMRADADDGAILEPFSFEVDP